MKVLYVVPNWKTHETKYTSVSLNVPNSIPLEYMYVENLLNDNIESKILDANLLNWDWEKLRDEIKKYSPDVIIFSTTINYILWRCPPVELEIPIKLMEACKDIKAFTIAIGPHSVVDAKEIYEKLKVDYMIVGEAEVALAEFLNSNLTNLKVRGLYGKNINNGIAEEVNLENLSIPTFNSVDITKYDYHVWSEDTNASLKKYNIKGTILEYSRGCVYNCPYCFRKGFREKFRTKTIKQMEEEIKRVKSLGIGYIYFIDEIFNIDSKEWRSLLAILKREGMLFGCQARPDIMTYEKVDLLRYSGCIYIEYGTESFSPEVLKSINKNLDLDKVKKIIAYSFQVFGKENVVISMINFYTKDVMTILDLKGNENWRAKVIRPYPNSYIGDKICEMYNITTNKWDFILRYLWWSQIENYCNYLNEDINYDESIKNKILYGDLEESKKMSYALLDKYINLIKKKFS
ncbi:B12-binding domain-containing radical SAM protein [Clostridium disporicum]|uniref:Fe-S oxidoreductase n=1 Tax=Clostridium disporicum TaxID=84024 RepID=A0A174EKF2_9CLOT|nr:radical SAM protein [Clostridium disporicum]CUO38452.1 Fe-S oxidoreductase [Clostridium disporicum]